MFLSNVAISSKDLAMMFHEHYERLAPSYGYKTRDDTKIFDPKSPNGMLMIEVCNSVLTELGRGRWSSPTL